MLCSADRSESGKRERLSAPFCTHDHKRGVGVCVGERGRGEGGFRHLFVDGLELVDLALLPAQPHLVDLAEELCDELGGRVGHLWSEVV